jgi:hypothetical protein
MTSIIKLTSAGANTGPFDLYSDADNYTIPFASGVTKDQLIIGYLTTALPSTVNNIKIISIGDCNSIINIPAPIIKLTCHDVRYGPAATDCDIRWIGCNDEILSTFVSAGQYFNIKCARSDTWSGCGPFVIQGTCPNTTTTTTTSGPISTNLQPLDCYILKQGAGKREYTIELSPEGGVVTLNLRQDAAPIKFEILHDGIKKATSGSFYGNDNIFNPNLSLRQQDPIFTVFNSGPFDNSGDLSCRYYSDGYFSYNDINNISNNIQYGLSTYPHYIWNGFTGAYSLSGDFNSLPIYSRQTEYTAETGSPLLLAKNIDGIGAYSGFKINFQQLMWWKYTSDDYAVNPNITVRITGFGGLAGWQIMRSC